MQDSLRDLHPSGLLQLCGIRYTGMLQHGDSQHRPTGQLLLLPSEVAGVTSTKPAGVSNPQALGVQVQSQAPDTTPRRATIQAPLRQHAHMQREHSCNMGLSLCLSNQQ